MSGRHDRRGYYHTDELAPASAIAETSSRLHGLTNVAGLLVSGRLRLSAIFLPYGRFLTELTWCSGATAGGALTNVWAALYDPSLSLLATTPDASFTWGANTARTFTFATPYALTVASRYYVGLCAVGGSLPSLLCHGSAALAAGAVAPVLSGNDDVHTGLTTPATAPADAAMTASGAFPYVFAR